jgi:hypothetical protein
MIRGLCDVDGRRLRAPVLVAFLVGISVFGWERVPGKFCRLAVAMELSTRRAPSHGGAIQSQRNLATEPQCVVQKSLNYYSLFASKSTRYAKKNG